jgi:hypothetical protein
MADLAFGPMSREIIEAVYRYSAEHDLPLMLIASRNQIDYDHGYVMDTYQFGNLIAEMNDKHPMADVIPCRDHCGYGFRPEQGNQMLDYESIKTTIWKDIENGFKLIHVDLCHHPGSYEEQLEETCRVIEFAREENPDIMIEVGTDENDSGCETDLEKVERELKLFRKYNPTFYVARTGSLVSENFNHDNFDIYKVRPLSELITSYGTALKEHNADYLSTESLQQRVGLVGGVNIAPQLGVVQTSTVLNLCNIYGVDSIDFRMLVNENDNWRKWTLDSENDMLCTMLAGHYHFNSDEYKEIIDQLPDDTEEVIIQNVTKVIEHYERNLYEVSNCRVCF